MLLCRVDEQVGGGRDVDVSLRWFGAKKVRRDTSETDLGRHVEQNGGRDCALLLSALLCSAVCTCASLFPHSPCPPSLGDNVKGKPESIP